MWKRRRVSSYRDETIAEAREETVPFDEDSWDAGSSSPKSATAGSSVFENRSAGIEHQQLVGYRVIRMLGRGTRATVYLGHRSTSFPTSAVPTFDDDGDQHAGPTGEPGPSSSAVAEFDELVALKLFHPATGRASIDLEVRVLTETYGPYVIGLTDIATTPGGGVVLVLPYLSGGTLAQLLERRARLLPGEAVNLLVPIATAVTQLYRSGFRHSSLTGSRVMFEARGTPVLAGIGRVRASQHASVTQPASAVDLREQPENWESEIWQSVAVLADQVLTLVDVGESNGSWLSLRACLAMPVDGSTLVPAVERFIATLFEWADPQAVAQNDPVIQPGTSNPATSQVPGRTHRAAASRSGTSDQARLGEPARPREQTVAVPAKRHWLAVFHLPTQLRDSVERALELNPVHLLKRAWRSVSARTRRMLATGGLVFTLLAVVLLAFPSQSQTIGSNRNTRSADSPMSETYAVDGGTRSRTVVSEDGDRMVSTAERAMILAPDPLGAIEILLVVRQRCLRERSMVCLLEVVQENTALMDADRARLRDTLVGDSARAESSASRTPQVGPQTHTATLVDRSGDAALILWEPRVAHENQPVSVLMMRAETGWRLREIFDF